MATEVTTRADLTFLLGMAFQLASRERADRLAAAGRDELRPVHALAFGVLRGTGATSSELADRLGITKQAAGQMVDDLEQRGYVQRHPHPAGGRRKLVLLTSGALDHLAVAERVSREVDADLAKRLGQRSADELRALLVDLARELAGEELPPLRPTW